MRVLILGFSSLEEIDSVMEKLIESTQCFLFTVVCGGADNVVYDWAQKVGAPVSFSYTCLISTIATNTFPKSFM